MTGTADRRFSKCIADGPTDEEPGHTQREVGRDPTPSSLTATDRPTASSPLGEGVPADQNQVETQPTSMTWPQTIPDPRPNQPRRPNPARKRTRDRRGLGSWVRWTEEAFVPPTARWPDMKALAESPSQERVPHERGSRPLQKKARCVPHTGPSPRTTRGTGKPPFRARAEIIGTISPALAAAGGVAASLSSVTDARYAPSSRHHQRRRWLDELATLISTRALRPDRPNHRAVGPANTYTR